MPRRTALVVPVPEAEAYYASDVGIPAHVTILFPFVERASIDEREVASVISTFDAFDFELDRVEHFDGGISWLHPEPSEPFAALTAAVWERWPDHPPYEGAHDEVVPHLTITVAADVPRIPIACRAAEVLRLEERKSGWVTLRSFALRQGVA